MSVSEVEVLRTLSGLEALAADWSRLAARFATPLLDHDWSLAAARTLHEENDLRIVVVRQDGGVTAIAPLVVERRLGGRLGLLGASSLYEPGGWLYASDEALARLARAVLGTGRVSVLHRLPADSTLCRQISTLARSRGFVVRRAAAASLCVEATEGAPAHQARLSGRAARKLRSMWTRARRAHRDVSVTRVRPASVEVADLVERFQQVEAAGWKARNGSALSMRPDLRAFFETYLARAAGRGQVRISTLAFDGETAAMELAVAAYRRHWTLKIGYDERFAVFGPGVLLTDASIKAVFDEALDGYEFLGSAEAWQTRWAPVRREYQLAVLYPWTPRTMYTVVSDAARYVARRIHDSGGHMARTAQISKAPHA